MNQAVEMGDVTAAGGQSMLSQKAIAATMNRKLGSIYQCASKTGQAGIGKVRLDLAIAGSGEVLGVSVRKGSSAFKSCVAGKTRSIRFPRFQAPRMGASFSFNVD